MIDQKRFERQEVGALKWRKAGGVGTLEYPTGLGKTFVAVNIIMHRMSIKDPNRRYVVVVPRQELKRQWEEIIDDAGIPNCSVHVINGLVQDAVEIDCDLLILDEIHRYASEEFRKVFSIVNYRSILGLTATLERMDGKHQYIATHCPIVDTITPEEARKNGWTSDYIEYALKIKMTPSEKLEYDRIHKGFSFYFGKFYHNFDTVNRCLNHEATRIAWATQHGWDPSLGNQHPWAPNMVMYYALRCFNHMQERKKFLYNLPSKIDAVKAIVNNLQGRKTIVFSESTDFADDIATALKGKKVAAYHSKIKPKSLRDKIVEKFKLGYLRIITAAKALDEGFDVPDVEVAIMASYTSNPTQRVQRRGRAVRKWKFKDGSIKKPWIIYLYTEGTQEEKWLTKALKNSINVIYVDDAKDVGRKTKVTPFG